MTINLATIDFSGVSSGSSAKLQEKSATILLTDTTTEILPDTGYDGMSKVSVSHGPVQETMEQTIKVNGTHIINPNEGYDAMFQTIVDVNVHPTEKLVRTYTTNGTYEIEGEYNGGEISVDTPEINNQEKSVTITENGTSSITPDTNYTGLSKVSVNTNIDTQSFYDNGYSQGKTDGKVEGIAEQKSKLTDLNITENGTYTREDGYKSVVADIHPTERLERTYTTNGTYEIEGEYNGGEISVDVSGEIDFSVLGYNDSDSNVCIGIINDNISYSQSLLAEYSDDKTYTQDKKLVYAPLFPTQNRTSFEYMFRGCSSLISVPTLDTGNGTNFEYMFRDCSLLTDVHTFDVSNGTNFDSMFAYCTALTNITFTGSINSTIYFSSSRNLTYDSIKSILTACAATTNKNAKTVSFSMTIADKNNELTNLVDVCTSRTKGWEVTGLTIQ